MLKLVIPSREFYNEKTEEFITTSSHELQLEHSLVSLSKWESKWLKPFLTNKDKSDIEAIDYVRCMTMSQNIDPTVYTLLTKKELDIVSQYIDAPMTATTFNQVDNKVTNKEVITAEIIYYWMVAFNIPFECQKWHLNRLLTLINVCNIKNQKPKKMNRKEAAKQQRAINEARKMKHNTSG